MKATSPWLHPLKNIHMYFLFCVTQIDAFKCYTLGLKDTTLSYDLLTILCLMARVRKYSSGKYILYYNKTEMHPTSNKVEPSALECLHCPSKCKPTGVGQPRVVFKIKM